MYETSDAFVAAWIETRRGVHPTIRSTGGGRAVFTFPNENEQTVVSAYNASPEAETYARFQALLRLVKNPNRT